MPGTELPYFEPGRVYRTRDLLPWGRNPARLAGQLVDRGVLRRLRRGLFEVPKMTKFGLAPAADDELVRAYLGTHDFVFTGSASWNALGLGATGVHAVTMVYNKKRSGDVTFGKRRFWFRRVAYPSNAPPPEWYAVDLLRHSGEAGVSRDDVLTALVVAVRQGRFDRAVLTDMARRFARAGMLAAVDAALSNPTRSHQSP